MMEVDSQDQRDVSMKDAEQDNTEVSTVGTPSSRGEVLRIVDQTIDDGGAVKYTVVWENGDTTEVRPTSPSTSNRTRAQCFLACGWQRRLITLGHQSVTYHHDWQQSGDWSLRINLSASALELAIW